MPAPTAYGDAFGADLFVSLATSVMLLSLCASFITRRRKYAICRKLILRVTDSSLVGLFGAYLIPKSFRFPQPQSVTYVW